MQPAKAFDAALDDEGCEVKIVCNGSFACGDEDSLKWADVAKAPMSFLQMPVVQKSLGMLDGLTSQVLASLMELFSLNALRQPTVEKVSEMVLAGSAVGATIDLFIDGTHHIEAIRSFRCSLTYGEHQFTSKALRGICEE